VRWERGNRTARIHLLLIDWPKSSSYAVFDTNICAALLSSRRQNGMSNNMIHMFDLSRPRGPCSLDPRFFLEFRTLGLEIINIPPFRFSHFLFFSSLSIIFVSQRADHLSPAVHGSPARLPKPAVLLHLDDSCLPYGHSLFSTPMNPLQMASLPGSHFTPDVALGKFPSLQNLLFWPRHHHRMPWTYAVCRPDPLLFRYLAPGQHACLHVPTTSTTITYLATTADSLNLVLAYG
jgi:hypothetical protein